MVLMSLKELLSLGVMNKDKQQQVKQIANQARRWAMLNSRSMYLNGMCAIASCHLFKQLQDAGIDSRIAINDQHCFLIVDHYIVDVTASQFGLPCVFIGSLENDECDHDFFMIEEEFHSIADLYQYQIDNGWPLEQRVLVN